MDVGVGEGTGVSVGRDVAVGTAVAVGGITVAVRVGTIVIPRVGMGIDVAVDEGEHDTMNTHPMRLTKTRMCFMLHSRFAYWRHPSNNKTCRDAHARQTTGAWILRARRLMF